MIKIIHFDERELLVMREIETKTLKDTEAKDTESLPKFFITLVIKNLTAYI